MLNCIIAGDEQDAIDVLAILVQQTGLLNLVYSTTRPHKAVKVINEQVIHLACYIYRCPA